MYLYKTCRSCFFEMCMSCFSSRVMGFFSKPLTHSHLSVAELEISLGWQMQKDDLGFIAGYKFNFGGVDWLICVRACWMLATVVFTSASASVSFRPNFTSYLMKTPCAKLYIVQNACLSMLPVPVPDAPTLPVNPWSYGTTEMDRNTVPPNWVQLSLFIKCLRLLSFRWRFFFLALALEKIFICKQEFGCFGSKKKTSSGVLSTHISFWNSTNAKNSSNVR